MSRRHALVRRHLFRAPLAALGVGVLTASCAGREPAPASVAGASQAADAGNVFAGARLYVNPDYAQTVERVARRAPAEAVALRRLATTPTAIWLDAIDRTRDMGRYLDDARAQQEAAGQPVVPLFVVYDLPGRDCAAEASNGELTPDADGEARYRRAYIDPIAAALRAHAGQRVALVLEPDSLANLATNMAVERCATAAPIYRRSIAYAITALALPNVSIYLDAGWAGWLGWPRNLARIVEIYRDVLAAAGGADKIRGFALNVSNYDLLKDPTNPRNNPDDPSPDELTYATDLAGALSAAGVTVKGFIVDTGRNGRAGIKTAPGNWCNIRGAGLGERPRATPAPLIDAYVWIKVPGESDGTADPKAARFDSNCASDDATPGAPEAGQLFESYLVELAKNANPPL